MKKLILIAIIASLLIVGCAQQAEVKKESEKIEVEMPAEEKKTSSLTQEDLDKLKADIEGIESEDLGGLSEE